MLKLVIVDFDDTVCLTEEACFIIENQVAEEMGFKPMTRETHRMNWGKPLEAAIGERVPGIDAREFIKRVSALIPIYSRDGLLDSVPPRNLEALDALKEAGKRLAILTSRRYSEVAHLLEQDHPINKRIEKIYHQDNSEFIKPDPRVFDRILKDFTTSPSEAVYVGDAVTDAMAAKGAGLHFIGVLEGGFREEKDFAGLKVDFFVKHFTDIVPYALSH